MIQLQCDDNDVDTLTLADIEGRVWITVAVTDDGGTVVLERPKIVQLCNELCRWLKDNPE